MKQVDPEKFQYVVWFRDNQYQPDDEDYEWCACFWIEASNKDKALAWGNHLARNYVSQHDAIIFLRSYLDSDSIWEDKNIVSVLYGEEISDNEVGW